MDLLFRILQRFRGFVPFVVSFTLVAAGCETAPPAPEDLSESRVSASEVAAAMAADPELLEVVELAAQITADFHAFGHTLADDELDAVITTITNPQYQESTDAPTLMTNLGSNPALYVQMRGHIQNLISRHGLQNASAEQVQTVFSISLSAAEVQDAIDAIVEEMLAEEKDPDVQACEDACDLAFDVTVGIEIAWYIAVVAGSLQNGLIVAAVVAIVAAVALMEAITYAEAVRNRCIEECNGIQDDDCDWDPDCAKDEYCWTGVLGIGKNECRPEKALDRTCSRDGQCASGCCKYHLPTNPLSKVCRPSNKCD